MYFLICKYVHLGLLCCAHRSHVQYIMISGVVVFVFEVMFGSVLFTFINLYSAINN